MIPLKQLDNEDFWIKLNPALTVSRSPFTSDLNDYEIDTGIVNSCVEQITVDGYFSTGPVLPQSDVQRVADAIEKIVDLNLPPVFIFVYDEAWQVFNRSTELVSAILDREYKLKMAGIWAWYIGKQGAGFRPHRDLNVLDVHSTGRPNNLTIWIPFTDSTPSNGCMYLLPTSLDPNYPDNLGKQDILDIQNIRAIPAAAGSILGWGANVLHWGAKSTPWAVQPRISIGVAYVRGDIDSVIDGYEENYGLGPELPLDQHPELPFASRLNAIGEAIWFYRTRVVDEFLDISGPLFDFCRHHYISSGQPRVISEQYSRLVGKARRKKALKALQSNKPLEALQVLEHACSEDPDNSETWQLLGQVHGALNALDKAESCFRRSLTLNPEDAHTLTAMGTTCVLRNRLDDAIAWYEKAVKQDARLVNAYYCLGNTFKLKQHLVEAVRYYRLTIELQPDHGDAYYNMAIALSRLNRNEDAINAAEKAYTLDPKNSRFNKLVTQLKNSSRYSLHR